MAEIDLVFVVPKDFTEQVYIQTSNGLLFDAATKMSNNFQVVVELVMNKIVSKFEGLEVYLDRFVDGGVPADPGQEALHLPVLHAHTTISMEVIWSRFRLKKSVICIRS